MIGRHGTGSDTNEHERQFERALLVVWQPTTRSVRHCPKLSHDTMLQGKPVVTATGTGRRKRHVEFGPRARNKLNLVKRDRVKLMEVTDHQPEARRAEEPGLGIHVDATPDRVRDLDLSRR